MDPKNKKSKSPKESRQKSIDRSPKDKQFRPDSAGGRYKHKSS